MKFDSDKEAITRLSSDAWDVARQEVLQPSATALADLGVWESPSFRCRFSVGPDQDSLRFDAQGNPCGHEDRQPCRTCKKGPLRLNLAFTPIPERSDSPWVVGICNRQSRERLPPDMIPGKQIGGRRLRSRLNPKRAATKNIPAADRDLTVVRLSLIYVAPEVPLEDLQAQIVVALLQGDVLQQPGQDVVSEGLDGYLKRSQPTGSDEVTGDVLRALWQNWRNPEDWRAWRSYIRSNFKYAARNRPRSSGLGTSGESDDGVRELDVGDWDVRPARPLVSDGSGQLNPQEAAASLGISKQRVYELIRHGKLEADGYKRIRVEEIERWRERSNRRRARSERIRQLQQNGLSYEAAKKRVQREAGHDKT